MYMASFKATRLITVQWKLYSEHEREFISRRNNADKCDLFLPQTRSDARNFYVTIKISWQVSMSLTGLHAGSRYLLPVTMNLSCVIYRTGMRRCDIVSSSTMGCTQCYTKEFHCVFTKHSRTIRVHWEKRGNCFINSFFFYIEISLSRVGIMISDVNSRII